VRDSEFNQRLDWLNRNDIALPQNTEEIQAAWIEVEKIRPSVFLEIGSLQGGSLYLYAGACKPDAVIISIDWPRSESHELKLIQTLKQIKADGQHSCYLRGLSHDEETLRRVRELTQSVDVLHIDGNHSLRAVRTDYEWYSPLVRSGGLILFHDVWITEGPQTVFMKASGRRKMMWCLGSESDSNYIRSGIGMVEVE